MVCISLQLAEKPGPAWVRSVDTLQQTFVGLAFAVSTEGHPLLLVEQVGDEALELGGILNLVLGLAKHQAEQAVLLAEVLQDQAVLEFEGRTVLAHQRAPVVARRHGGVLIPGFLYVRRRSAASFNAWKSSSETTTTDGSPLRVLFEGSALVNRIPMNIDFKPVDQCLL